MLQKFTSRKFLMALLGVITAFLILFGFDESFVEKVTAIGVAIIPIIVYIGVEGSIDVKRLMQTGLEVIDILDGPEDDEETPNDGSGAGTGVSTTEAQ